MGEVGYLNFMVSVKQCNAVISQDKIGGERFPVVAIGASAGGLKACESFLAAVPGTCGMAFILLFHLDPDHASLLPEIIRKKTSLKVLPVVDNMMVEPERIYILPQDKEMRLESGVLRLFDLPRPHSRNLPINTFFRSQASEMGPRAVAVILSGSGNDGTVGIKAVKSAGGLVLAQEPSSAAYDGMPNSAIATGLVDDVLAPAAMPARLQAYAEALQGRKLNSPAAPKAELPDEFFLQQVFALLHKVTKHDFSGYKKNTILRRLDKRMEAQQINRLEDYLRYLRQSEREVMVLFKDLLIGVTRFFRDPAVWEKLKSRYLPELYAHRSNGNVLRIWIPGCSTGEEVYSLAMVMRESMVETGRSFTVQIFATDLDDEAVDRARKGIYPETIQDDIDQYRLENFFVRHGNGFMVSDALREMVVFARQDVVKDPPFIRLDLLCCRNLLIYFEPELQKKLLPVFRYSLKDDGLLLLGTSETIGRATDLFRLLDKKIKIYRCQPSVAANRARLSFPLSSLAPDAPEKKMSVLPKPTLKLDTVKLLQAVLSQSHLPACVVVDENAEIVYFHGRTGLYLEPAEGESSLNLTAMSRPGLKSALARGLRQVTETRQQVKVEGLRIKNNGSSTDFNLTLRPLPDLQPDHRNLFLVVFTETKPAAKPVSAAAAVDGKDAEVRRLEDELMYTRENLQTTIEELEAANEELKSTNEELQSTNEELQSTNEELETAKEEQQSLNEESATVNAELQSRIDELMEANDDIKNLLDATEIATIFLDQQFHVRRFTCKTVNIFPLTVADLGRPLSHFSSTLIGVDLLSAAEAVLDTLEKKELTAQARDGVSYRIRLRPYRSNGNVIGGVVITFEDITELVSLQNELETALMGGSDSR